MPVGDDDEVALGGAEAQAGVGDGDRGVAGGVALEGEVAGDALAGEDDRHALRVDRQERAGGQGELAGGAADREGLVDRLRRRVDAQRDLLDRGEDPRGQADLRARRDLAGEAVGREQQQRAAVADAQADVVGGGARVARVADEQLDVGGGDLDDRLVVGGAELLVGPGAHRLLERELAFDVLAEDRRAGGDLDAHEAPGGDGARAQRDRGRARC